MQAGIQHDDGKRQHVAGICNEESQGLFPAFVCSMMSVFGYSVAAGFISRSSGVKNNNVAGFSEKTKTKTGPHKKKKQRNSSHSFDSWELKRFILSCVDFTQEARAGCNKSNIVCSKTHFGGFTSPETSPKTHELLRKREKKPFTPLI